MTDNSKLCDHCHSQPASWPRTLTVVGPMDLCGPCYWHYLHLIEGLATYCHALPIEKSLQTIWNHVRKPER
jgi:hypothetical protein